MTITKSQKRLIVAAAVAALTILNRKLGLDMTPVEIASLSGLAAVFIGFSSHRQGKDG